MLFDSPKDIVLGKFWFSAIFSFSRGKLGPKMDQNCKFFVCSIFPLTHNFERLFKCQDVKTYGSINYGKMLML